jgi:hypothetical protein
MPGLGIFLFVVLVGGLAGGEMLARLLPRWGRPEAVRVVRRFMLAGAAMYLGALLTVSLTSQERVLPRGETLRFCGFYLDCHLGVAVEGVKRHATIGERRAAGVFYVVAVRVSSDARRATLHLARPELLVVDREGRSYARSLEAEEALGASGDSASLVRPVPAGESYLTSVVFDLPAEIEEPRLLARDVSGIDRVLEAVLIGDEDSFLHKPAVLALN